MRIEADIKYQRIHFTLKLIGTLSLICFLFGKILLLSYCSSNESKVSRFYEKGIEIVLNPNISQDELIPLKLEMIFLIDTEDEDILDFGLTDIWGFNVSRDGDIFVFRPPQSQGNLIFRFDNTGAPVLSFGKKGQGPGEIQWPLYQKINRNNEIAVLDRGGQKILLYDKNGNLKQEKKPDKSLSGGGIFLELPNGNYLFRESVGKISGDTLSLVMSISDSELNIITELGRLVIENPITSSKFKYPLPVFSWAVSDDSIYIGSEEYGYEIHVYDFNGVLKRKIRKEYTPIPYSVEQKNEVLKMLEEPEAEFLRNKIVFPEYNPPFQHLFVSNENQLFVMTFEQGDSSGEYMIDIFDVDGILISKFSLDLWLSGDILQPEGQLDSWTSVLNNRLYYVKEKETGYRALVVCELK
jgi:hypothetical protein